MSERMSALLTAPIFWLQDKKGVLSHMCVSWLLGCRVKEAPGLGTVATDGAKFIGDYDFFSVQDLRNRSYMAAHEALHGILRHVEQFKTFGTQVTDDKGRLKNSEAMRRSNIAMDIIINTMLEKTYGERITWVGKDGKNCSFLYHDSKITKDGRFSSTEPGTCLLNATDRAAFNLDDCDWFWVYQRLILPKDGKGSGEGMAGGEDMVMGDAEDARQAESAAARAIAAGREIAKLDKAGNTPGWLERLLGDMGNSDKNWRKELEEAHTSSLASEMSFKKLRKPYVFFKAGLPTISRPGVGKIVCALDTSGSITADILKDAGTELHAIWKQLRPELIYILSIDTEVHDVTELGPDDPFTLNPIGGGGTCFEPAFEWAEENAENVTMMVYITDGYGSFPEVPPDYPVIWVVLRGGASSEAFPFGKVVRLD